MLWLTARQLKSKSLSVRRRALEPLVRNPSLGAVRVLERALEDPEEEIRRLAVSALGKLRDKKCLDPLVRALRDRSPEVVKDAINALKRVSEPQRVTAALTPLVRRGDAGVRGYAVQTLEQLGWRPTDPEEQIWWLVAKGDFVRAADFGPAAVPILEEVLVSCPSSIGVRAVHALGQISDPRVLRPLVRGLRSDDPAITVAAVEALHELGDSQAIEPLVGVLRHANPRVRAAAVEALGRLRAVQALDQVQPLLADPVWEVRRHSAEALGRLRDPRAVDALAQALADRDADVRETTALALGNIRDRRAIRPLVLTLKDPITGVRRIAAAALSRIDPEWCSFPEARSALEDLRPALQDGDGNVRHFVGQLLASLGRMAPEDALADLPQDSLSSDPAKRRKLAVTLFAAVLCDPDRDLRQAAAEALGQLGDPRIQGALLRAQADPDEGVCAAASQALLVLETAAA